MQKEQNTPSGLKLWKVILVCILLLCTAGFVHSFDTESETKIQKSLQHFPYKIDKWEAQKDLEVTENVAAMLGVDDYTFRNYYSQKDRNINFYASYFAANNRNKGFHSPLNCMPGSGWNIAETEEVSVQLNDGREVTLKKLLLQRGSDYQLALYWYQCRSRIIASEYWERIYRVLDSIRYGRTDGAFVRLIMPLKGQSQGQALQELKSFAVQIIPHLEEHLPGV